MKTLILLIFSVVFVTIHAQTIADTNTLLPDQNPNYQKSRDKYVAESATLTKNEGQTVQQTYKAIDDVQAKKERKELASQRRQDRRMARIQSRGQRNRYYGNYDYNNYNNGYYANGYTNPYGFYHPQYYSNNIFRNVNPILNTTLYGLAIWSLLRR
jgi:hypothetical protein